MTLTDNILDLAIDRLQNGETIDAIANDYPEYQEELVGLLQVLEMGVGIPKLVPPTPIKRRLYEEKKATGFSKLFEILSLSRVSIIPIALVVTLIGGPAIVNATQQSLPGDTLYSLKRATEEARLTFTRNPEKLAIIHVELMQKRVDEVRQAADSGDESTETKALAELQSQSTKTFAEVAPVATANAISKQDSSLLDTLLAVNQEQKDVLEDLSGQEEESDAKTVASSALLYNVRNDQTLAKIIATVNDQTLIDLPNKISITGSITAHYSNRVTVEKNTFTINEKTTITDINNEILTADSKLSGRATIIGLKVDGALIAKQIVLLPEDTGVVQGDTTTTPTSTPVIKPTIKPTEPVQTPEETPIEAEPKASGTFITEPIDQNYSF